METEKEEGVDHKQGKYHIALYSNTGEEGVDHNGREISHCTVILKTKA